MCHLYMIMRPDTLRGASKHCLKIVCNDAELLKKKMMVKNAILTLKKEEEWSKPWIIFMIPFSGGGDGCTSQHPGGEPGSVSSPRKSGRLCSHVSAGAAGKHRESSEFLHRLADFTLRVFMSQHSFSAKHRASTRVMCYLADFTLSRVSLSTAALQNTEQVLGLSVTWQTSLSRVFMSQHSSSAKHRASTKVICYLADFSL